MIPPVLPIQPARPICRHGRSGCRIAANGFVRDTPSRRAAPSRAERSGVARCSGAGGRTYSAIALSNVSRCQSSCINIIRRPIIQLHGGGLGVPSRARIAAYIRPEPPSNPLNMDIIGRADTHSCDLSVTRARHVKSPKDISPRQRAKSLPPFLPFSLFLLLSLFLFFFFLLSLCRSPPFVTS